MSAKNTLEAKAKRRAERAVEKESPAANPGPNRAKRRESGTARNHQQITVRHMRRRNARPTYTTETVEWKHTQVSPFRKKARNRRRTRLGKAQA